MLDLIKKISDLLQGKKVYLVSIATIIEALIQYTTDGDLSGCINKILLALGAMAGRSTLKKLENK